MNKKKLEKQSEPIENRPSLNNVPDVKEYTVDINLQVAISESYFDEKGNQKWNPAGIESKRFSTKLENKNSDDCNLEVLEKINRFVKDWE